ncbi:MAG: VWA domain-containing protein [Rhizobiales bacterium]|nr:VWA domain-containing protein [Hyphomicrobiales bacterium]
MQRIALIFAMIAATLSAPVQAQDKGQQKASAGDTVLILDASGSMWGIVEGQSKIAAARQAVGSILSKWNPSDRLGVMAYGHRSKGDCNDIEMIRPVGPVDAREISSTVERLNPKGKTPLTQALRQAAQSLKSNENKSTVILVSDGIETCNADPCAAAAELKKAGIGFVAHVIGLDVTDPLAKAQLQCIARNTGGVYLDAANASGLQQALGRAVDVTQGKKVVSEAPARAATVDPFRGKPLRATVRLAEGLDPVTDGGLVWVLYKPGTDGEEKGEYIATEYGARLAMAAEPGKYMLEVSLEETKRLFPVEVVKGALATYDFVLDAGYVTSEGNISGSGAKAQDVTWELRRGDESVTTKYDAVPKFVVPAGAYSMVLRKGTARAVQAFSIAPGDVMNLAMSLDAGRLLADALYTSGGPKVENGLTVEVRRPQQVENEPGEWVATEYEPLSVFDLPTGSYDIKMTVGKAQKVQRIEIKSGQPMRLTLILEAGVLAIDAPGADKIEIVAPKKDINGERKVFETFYDAKINFAFNAGDYVAIVTRGDTSKEQPVKVTAGERNEVTIN